MHWNGALRPEVRRLHDTSIVKLDSEFRTAEPPLTEQDTWAAVYLNGLLSEQPRKSRERIALRQGVNICDLQHFNR